MRQRSGLMNLFWTVMAVLAVGAALFGGYVAWKLVHSAAPNVERANIDPEQLLERTVSARQEEMANTQTEKQPDLEIKDKEETATNTEEEVEPKSGTNTKKSNVSSLKNETDPYFWEEDDYFDDEEDVSEEEFAEDEENLKQKDEFSYTLEDVSTAQQTAKPAAKPKAPSPKSVAPKVIYASYAQGLAQCQKGNRFPCSWKDNSGPLVKQYWLKSPQGPVERVIFTHNGKIISQTFSTVAGVVTRYQGTFAELYFENNLLSKIRTFPYDNPNLRDWFLIDSKGKISACLCGVPTKDCCARSSLYREGGPRRYCDLFPLDPDFCKK